MNTLGKQIKNRRLELGISQDKLAEMLGYTSRSTIAKIESGENDLTQSKIENFAKALNCTPAYLMGWEDEPNGTGNNNTAKEIPGVRPVTVKTIPLFKEISCGVPVYTDDDVKCYVPVGSEIEADFCVIANGDSMTGARINDGDVVFIKETEQVQNGEIAAVWIDGEGATLKRVYIQDDTLSLIAENPKYPPLVFTAERAHEVRLLGKAVVFQSNVI